MRLKETYLNNDITETGRGRKQQARVGGAEMVEVKKERARDEREVMMTMSCGCDSVSSDG